MPPHPYWSPPETHIPALPMYYYDPAFSGPPFMFPASIPPSSPPGLPLQYAQEPAHIAIHSQLHPQAPAFVPSGLTAKALPRLSVPNGSPSPSPAPRIDPLAQALRRAMPKIRNSHRPAPGERRPSPESMEASSISDKFLYVEGIPRAASGDDLKTTLESLGQLRGIFVRLQAEHGVVILAFYDSRHASQALSKIQENPHKYFEAHTLSARIPSYPELKQILSDSPVLVDSDSRVYVTLVGRTTLLGPQMQGLLATFGDLKLFRVVGMHYKRFHAEFFDSRDSAQAIVTLNNHKLHGAIVHLSADPHSNVVSSSRSSNAAEDVELANLLQAADLKAPEDEHAYIEGVPFPSDGRDDTPTTPSSSGIFDHRARYGRRASTGSAFPSSSPRSASSTDNLLSDAHSPGVPFPTYPDDHSPQEPSQEPRRRRSVAHSFDSASASASSATSLSFKLFGTGTSFGKDSTPLFSLPSDRTVSTAPSTPAGLGRKMSLPPFQALPPPSNNQWTSAAVERDEEDERVDDLDGFIQVRGSHSSRSSSGLGGSAAHMCLPASARAVLDLLRDPPPERNRVDIARIEAGLDTRTTIMLKNIPNKMSTKNLIDFIEVVTPRAIDFLYLRFDFQNECNVGYAFVNFINISDLLKFMKARLGRKWNMYASEKVLGAGYANYQGKEALIEKFKNSSIMDTRPVWRPRIFYSSGEHVGLPQSFPGNREQYPPNPSFFRSRPAQWVVH
ncbi:RNA recognition motif protein [Rhizoctonia solani]|uniref:RNA recognition motif protein n=1 Tax=Rhizoctonia solani TaxID=456999 RepID=A0A8H8SYU3_9AGAM|nr:RNA recognition motif protein [Rhizoctonia solani]QRW21703.1 RNA recognition motif protein [Rhizoctonia solani]